jgi:hypothetical protein
MEFFVDLLHQTPTCAQARKWFKFMFMTTFSRFCNITLILVLIIFFIYGGNIWGSTKLTSSTMSSHSHHDTCVWKEGDPQLFHLKTSSGVHYDGGHWFHVAENFMVQHTLMRQRQKSQGIGLASSSEVYLSLDRDAVLGESNSMTRFMLGLGLTDGLFKLLHFIHVPQLDLSHSNAQPGDSMFIPSKAVLSHQVSGCMNGMKCNAL